MPAALHHRLVELSSHRALRRRQRGLSLIELVMFIVVVGLALVALLSAFSQATVRSADPQLQRQALSIAESLLEEVQLMPFTFCDPDDAAAATAGSAADCAQPEAVGAEAGESRYATPQFDNVNDYHQLTLNGIVDISQTAVAGLSGFNAQVTVSPAALGSISAASGDALRISVEVSGPGGTFVSLDGYRSRHAPNATL